MAEKSNQELAVELTKALLEHNQTLTGGAGIAKDTVVSADDVAHDFAILLKTITESTDSTN